MLLEHILKEDNRMKISVCGKGGNGKSVLTSLLASQALSRGLGVIVVDSDESNFGLFKMLGFETPPVPLMELVGGKKKLRENMCLSTLYVNSENMQKEIMEDVARIEAEGEGFWFINLFGERKFIDGTIQTVNFMDSHFVVLTKSNSN
jgi:predicted RNA-binding protein